MILSNPFNQHQFTEFVNNFLPDFSLDMRKVESGNSGFKEVLRLGSSSSIRTDVLIIRSSKNINNRISLTNSSFKIMKKFSMFRVLAVYVNDDETIWRLSLLTATPSFKDGKIVQSLSNPRRHSYVLGTEVGIATAKKYLSSLGPIADFEDLQYRFSVEAVNKDFYKEIAEHFYGLVGKYDEKKKLVVSPKLKIGGDSPDYQSVQHFGVRLLGRLIFLWFLKHKESSAGIPLLPSSLLELEQSKENFYLERLQPLFFEVLNKPLENREIRFSKEPYALVPYLNGGLFSPSTGASGDYYSDLDRKRIQIQNSWFSSLFSVLGMYNFTIDENLENDVDLSIDPEMLGRVFENLLAEINPETKLIARKSTGSYYTPRKVVNYMVDKAVESYLESVTKIDLTKIRALISITKIDDVEHPLNISERQKIAKAVLDFKCLDPACGSGAFPMGLLHKLAWVLGEVDPVGEFLETYEGEHLFTHWSRASRLQFLRKWQLIRDCIFGVDIQSVAVEIAKLRCFLTLIVDQEISDVDSNRGVIPLPNLEFKFIAANTLISLPDEGQMFLGDDPDLESKILKIKKNYFETTDPLKKVKLKGQYESLVESPPTLFKESLRNKLLKTYRPFDSNAVADFFNTRLMFNLEGFDIVIGNPPYVSADNSDKALKEIYKKQYSTAVGKYDLYYLFYQCGIKLLKRDSSLLYITPNKFCAADSAETLRNLFKTSGNMEILSLSKLNVFESASNYPVIATIKKTDSPGSLVFREALSLEDLEESSTSTYSLSRDQFSVLPKTVFPINVSAKKLEVVIKLCSTFPRLETLIDFSEGLRIPGEKEESTKRDFMIVKQYQFERWSPITEGSYITKSNLSKIVSNTSDRYLKAMKPKILVAEDALKISATFDGSRAIPQGGIYFGAPDDPWYVLGLLNSSVLSEVYAILFGGMHMGGGYLRYRKNFLEALPVPNADEGTKKQIGLLAKKAITLYGNGTELEEIEDQIDSLVAKSLELSKDEVATLIN